MNKNPFRIKICGIGSAEDARLATQSGADAVGLNFFVESPRYVTPEAARRIASQIPADVWRVGVFVNSDPANVHDIATHVGLDAIQLHGDESVEVVVEIARHYPVIRAFRCRENGLAEVKRVMASIQERNIQLAGALLDAHVPGQFGGTGQKVEWSQLAGLNGFIGGSPLILAGGLNDTNVGEAIREVRPSAVDTASGVESAPGIKQSTLVKNFVAAAREAFEEPIS